jgi:signal transduction histidine kinase
MRSTTRMILPLLAIMGAFVVIVVMLARTSRLDYGVLAGRLHHLKNDHAVLVNSVLRVHQGHPEHVSTVVAAQDHVIADTKQLQDWNGRDRAADSKLRSQLRAYTESVAELMDHVEHFKSANAIEHNSLHYLPQLADSIHTNATDEANEISRKVERLLRAVAVQLIDSSNDSRDDVAKSLREFKAMQSTAPKALAAPLNQFVQHAEKVLETQPLVDLHLDAIVASPAENHLMAASTSVADKSDQVLDRQQLLQLALIVIGAMLVGYVGALLWMLRLSVQELDAANQALEETINQRVAELELKSHQLFQAQKLESIGQLAAGIAHEINTPMQFVYDNLEFLSESAEKLFQVLEVYDRNLNATGPRRSWKERSDEVASVARSTRFEHIRAETPKAIRESIDGILRVINIVRAMKEFSHPGQEELVGVDLNNLVHMNATMTRNRWKYVAEVEFDLDPDLPTLRCVPGEVNQLLLNLIVNAADAIAEKVGNDIDETGTITIRTRHNAEQIVIEVVDTGCGMPPEIRNRIFDPFFTTKDPGKGTGQGLSICYNVIVNKLHGTISVDSTQGVGTQFTLTIPLPDGAAPLSTAAPSLSSDLELEPQACLV